MHVFHGHQILTLHTATRDITQDEIEEVSTADIITIIISYIVMFVYVGITLGDVIFSVRGCLLYSKV